MTEKKKHCKRCGADELNNNQGEWVTSADTWMLNAIFCSIECYKAYYKSKMDKQRRK